jgi:proteasome lid subunit RPN8/RPN11
MLTLASDAADELRAHAHEGAPAEVCGVLGGSFGREHSRVATVHRTDNAAATPRTAYVVDPAELYDRLRTIEDAGRDVVGFYHSHPAGPAEPSPRDVDQATWTGYSDVLVSLDGAEPTVGSWRWRGEGFEREEVVVD